MTTLIVTFGFFAGAMALMAVGLLAGRALRGSCGGVGDCACSEDEICEKRRRAQGDEPPPSDRPTAGRLAG